MFVRRRTIHKKTKKKSMYPLFSSFVINIHSDSDPDDKQLERDWGSNESLSRNQQRQLRATVARLGLPANACVDIFLAGTNASAVDVDMDKVEESQEEESVDNDELARSDDGNRM